MGRAEHTDLHVPSLPPEVDLINPCEVALVLTVLMGDLVAGANLSVVFLTCPCQPCGLRASLPHSAPSFSPLSEFLALRSVRGCLKLSVETGRTDLKALGTPRRQGLGG